VNPVLTALLVALCAGKATVPAQPLPSLAVITRARVEVARDSIVTTTDVTFARGDWTSGDLDLYVAFGAPGIPRAFDARLVSTAEDDASASLADPGEVVPAERSVNKPDHALALLGSPHMAGEIVHAKEPALRRAFAMTGRATLRVRQVVLAPPADAQGSREVLLRLGTQPSPPLALAAVEVVARDGAIHVQSAEARLCGSGADPYPIAVVIAPAPTSTTVTYPRPTSPLAVVRHPSDDLCIRYTFQ
jgi:hypothetical protein